jgi:hypothetical protein
MKTNPHTGLDPDIPTYWQAKAEYAGLRTTGNRTLNESSYIAPDGIRATEVRLAASSVRPTVRWARRRRCKR